MHLYWAAIIALIIIENGVKSEMATTPLHPEKHFRKDEMARLINIVREAKKHSIHTNNEPDDNENNQNNDNDDSPSNENDDYVDKSHYDDKQNHLVREKNIFVPKYISGKNKDKKVKSEDALRIGMDLINRLISDKTLVTTYEVANPLDLSYFDLLNEKKAIKERDLHKRSKSALYKLLAERSKKEKGDDVRLHFIKNPSVIEEYKKKIMGRRGKSTSSSSEDSDVSYDSDENSKRRNAVFNMGRASENRKSKSASRPSKDHYVNYQKQTPRAYEKDDKEKIVVTFRDRNEYYDKPRKNDKKYKEKDFDSPKKDDWDAVTKKMKSDDFWDDQPKKKHDSNTYKKDDPFETDDHYKNDNKNHNKDDYYKNDDNNRNENKRNKKDDHYKNDDRNDKKNRKDDYYKKDDNQNESNKKLDSFNDKKKYNDDYDNKGWNKKESKSKDSKKDDWDKPVKSDSWDSWKPPKSQERDNKRNNDWGDKEITKKQANRQVSVEKYTKSDFDKDFDKGKKSTSEWDRPMPSRSAGSAPKRNPSYVAKISEYYNPRPRHHDSREKGGYHGFGRTSIPFVGKKGIYEDKK